MYVSGLRSAFTSFVFAVSATAGCQPPPLRLLAMVTLIVRAQDLFSRFLVSRFNLARIQMSFESEQYYSCFMLSTLLENWFYH